MEQESGWHPFVTRFEPAFDKKYVAPLHQDWSEDKGRSTSFGLMQIMGEIARELRFVGDFKNLLDPATNLEFGCTHFANKLLKAGGVVETALLFWNGGSNKAYPAQVLARQATYQAQKPPQSAEEPNS